MPTLCRGPHFLPYWKSKNSTTPGQFSRECFFSPFSLQLEMLGDSLTAESGGLGRRLFDQGWVSSETSFILSLSFPHIPPCFPSLPLCSPSSLLLSILRLPLSDFFLPLLCKLPARWPWLLAPKGSQTGGGSVTQSRQMGALRMASQESKHWREGGAWG